MGAFISTDKSVSLYGSFSEFGALCLNNFVIDKILDVCGRGMKDTKRLIECKLRSKLVRRSSCFVNKTSEVL